MTSEQFDAYLRKAINSYYGPKIHYPTDIHKFYGLSKDKYVLMTQEDLSNLLADKIRQGILSQKVFPADTTEIEMPHCVDENVVNMVMEKSK